MYWSMSSALKNQPDCPSVPDRGISHKWRKLVLWNSLRFWASVEVAWLQNDKTLWKLIVYRDFLLRVEQNDPLMIIMKMRAVNLKTYVHTFKSATCQNGSHFVQASMYQNINSLWPSDDIDLGQHWLTYWLGAWWPITWINVIII